MSGQAISFVIFIGQMMGAERAKTKRFGVDRDAISVLIMGVTGIVVAEDQVNA